MIDEIAFLRRLMARPDDPASRLAYAEWLEQRGDPRAEIVRMEPDLERICCIDWLETQGKVDGYLRRSPELKEEEKARRATAHARARRRALGAEVDPDWLAFITTLGCPFHPFFFFNNQGNPRECQPDELPFAEPVGTRGSVVTFESDFRDEASWEPGLMRDLGFLGTLELEDCYFGAASCPVHPFLCELKAERPRLTGADVLASLRPRAFRGPAIKNLKTTSIPFPGEHPGDGRGGYNDQIHNDFEEQYIFKRAQDDPFTVEWTDQYGRPISVDDDDDEDDTEGIDEWSGTHGEIKRYVAGGQLWYVLMHTTPREEGEYLFSRYAVLLAVGRSPDGRRLLGVITHQVCHNLCD